MSRCKFVRWSRCDLKIVANSADFDTFVVPTPRRLHSNVFLETLIIFLLNFLHSHLLFEYSGISLPSLFLEPSPRVKQAAGLTCKSPRGLAVLIYLWIVCSASKPLKCSAVVADFPKGISLSSNCLYDGETERWRLRDVMLEREREKKTGFYLTVVEFKTIVWSFLKLLLNLVCLFRAGSQQKLSQDTKRNSNHESLYSQLSYKSIHSQKEQYEMTTE